MTSTSARTEYPAPTNSTVTRYHTANVDGIDIFYREAGPSDAPAVVLLHGFPSSSRMFRNLIPKLADTYHVIAPDYPAFGHSAMPDRKRFSYTFARFTELIDADNWVIDQALLDRPGNAEIMLDLFYDLPIATASRAGRTSGALLPDVQRYFQSRQPPMLIVWGANDKVFTADSARAYLKDLPNAELHLLDTGHFALEDKGDEIATLMHDFLDRHVPRA